MRLGARGIRRGIARFAPPIVWMGVIAALSSSFLGGDRTAAWVISLLNGLLPGTNPATVDVFHAVLRKMGHVVEYGVLAVLWRRALGPDHPTTRATAWAVGLSALYAALDETRQGLTPNRSPSALDVGLDTASAGLAAVAWETPRQVTRVVVRLARWAVLLLALGSLGAAVVDWTLGLGGQDLTLAALGLACAGWILVRLEHAWRRPS